MKINFIAVGSLNAEYKKLFDEYKKRIGFFCTLNVFEVKEVNNENIFLKKQKETEAILKLIPNSSKVYLCSLQGKMHTSEEFSNLLQVDNISFVIGGSNGVIEEMFDDFQRICFSTMTFPHQLFRIILVEQVYRGFSILNNSKYHK